MKYILGLSSFFHDSAATLLRNGEIIGAVQEERFTRVKHDSSFPINSIKYLLKTNNLTLDKISHITFYEKPILKFDRLLETYLKIAPKGFQSFKMSFPSWIKEKLFLKSLLTKELAKLDNSFDANEKLLFSTHHLSHAASTFYPSNFQEASILIVDGVGEWATTSIGLGKENGISIIEENHYPHSIGLLYSAFTYYLGFKVNSGEYKVMGLAPYGEPKYYKLIFDHLVDLKTDGSFSLNQKYFNYIGGLTMTNNDFNMLFSHSRRKETDQLQQFHMDIAASIQKVTEDILINITRYMAEKYQNRNLCLAGGVALNCVANSKILKDNYFKNIWIQPAAGDAGGSLGAALYTWYDYLGNKRNKTKSSFMKNSLLGPSYNDKEIKLILINVNAKFEKLSKKDLLKKVSDDLSRGKVVGWFQGKMEFGPRSLGSRSILADPRNVEMQKKVNLKIKFRESFRPFAPSILEEDTNSFFNLSVDSPYMLFVGDVVKKKRIALTKKQQDLFGIEKLNQKRSIIPAVTHVDYSARIQTVSKETNNLFYDLIKQFKVKTGCPVLLNTSFNVRGEPIVCSPKDAFDCFMNTDLDVLAIGNYYLKKEQQDCNYKKERLFKSD